jgi:hypothetical protein
VTPAQWRLSRRTLEAIAREGGLGDRMLAERLGVTVAELRPVLGMLLGRGKVQRCDDYLVIVPQARGRSHERPGCGPGRHAAGVGRLPLPAKGQAPGSA